jgi:hypothetical protein
MAEFFNGIGALLPQEEWRRHPYMLWVPPLNLGRPRLHELTIGVQEFCKDIVDNRGTIIASSLRDQAPRRNAM